ncbi:hypothetical protein [Aliikangiella maris]|uniref:Uncharacterized protein n=2 Tax=Aliikangiella maris TaxID=3162458 RepID=A0ABV2BWU2_9GAMM
MSLNISQLYAELSAEDKQLFTEILNRLTEHNGDLTKLSVQDQQTIQHLEAQYAGQDSSGAHQDNTINDNESDFLTLPFAQYVRQILARDLGGQFPLEEEAIGYAFDNKWLPLECQRPELIEELFERFKADIVEINRWRSELVDVSSDIKMAVGLAWFMVIFQLNQRINQ